MRSGLMMIDWEQVLNSNLTISKSSESCNTDQGYSWDTALIKLRDEIYQYHIYFHLLSRENDFVNRTKSGFSHPGKNGNIGITGNYHISMNKKIRFE